MGAQSFQIGTGSISRLLPPCGGEWVFAGLAWAMSLKPGRGAWDGGVVGVDWGVAKKPLSCSANDLARAKSNASLSPPQGREMIEGLVRGACPAIRP